MGVSYWPTVKRAGQTKHLPQKHFADEPILVHWFLAFPFRYFSPHLCYSSEGLILKNVWHTSFTFSKT